MASPRDLPVEVRLALRMAAVEGERADRAALAAARFAAQSSRAPEVMKAVRLRMAELYKKIELRHLAAARLHTLYSARLHAWCDRGEAGTLRTAFVSAVAEALRMDGATLSLVGRRQVEATTSSSDATARAVHDLGLLYGESPVLEAVSTGRITLAGAGGGDLRDRWPLFGPAVTELGVRSIVAVPLLSASTCLGTLSAFSAESAPAADVTSAAGRIADALTYTLLRSVDESADADEREAAGVSALVGSGDQAVVHQAAGMVSVQHGCDIDDAFALLRARAFSAGLPVEAVARQVVGGQRRIL